MTSRTKPGNASPHIRSAADFAAAYGVPAETTERLQRYVDTLRLWQPRINLVSPQTLDHVWHRHIADSAQIVSLAPEQPGHWVDLGSGAGFPGLVVAIMLAGNGPAATRVTLVESDQRKCAFMREVVRQTSLAGTIPVDILCMRIEEPATQARLASVDVVSARALASLSRLLELAVPMLDKDTTALFMKGRTAADEISEAQRSWIFDYDIVPSTSERDARIVRIRGAAVRREGETP
ncbi:MAG: 16S rRNA (guanine(527)-N(7))-methyltransferase RsmG [Hyphomicrobiaceae bacterium]